MLKTVSRTTELNDACILLLHLHERLLRSRLGQVGCQDLAVQHFPAAIGWLSPPRNHVWRSMLSLLSPLESPVVTSRSELRHCTLRCDEGHGRQVLTISTSCWTCSALEAMCRYKSCTKIICNGLSITALLEILIYQADLAYLGLSRACT